MIRTLNVQVTIQITMKIILNKHKTTGLDLNTTGIMRNCIIRSTFIDPFKNLALGSYIMKKYLQGKFRENIMMLSCSHHGVMIGRNQNYLAECNLQAMKDENVPLIRRESGGGACHVDRGNRLFTLIGNDTSREKNYGIIVSALKNLGVNADVHGRNDVVVNHDGKRYKLSGSAFNVSDGVTKHHGTILHNVDKNRLSRYLNPSKLKLQSHGIKSIKSRVANITDFQPHVTMDDLDTSLILSFSHAINCEANIVDFDDGMIHDKDCFNHIYERLTNSSFIYNENPKSNITLEYKNEMGLFTFDLIMDKGMITAGIVYSDCLDVDHVSTLQQHLNNTVPISVSNINNPYLFTGENLDVFKMLMNDLNTKLK